MNSTHQELTRAKHILDQINEACYELNRHGNVIFANKKCEQLFAMKKEQMLGRNIWDLFPESVSTLCYEAIQKNALEKKEYSQFEYVSAVIGKWISLSAMPSDEGCIVMFHDIEETKQAQLKLQEECNTILEHMPDAITRWNNELKMIYANSAFEGRTGVPNETLIGKNSREMGQPLEIAIPWMESLQKVFETGKAVEHYNTFPTPSGQVHFYSRIVPEKNVHGSVDTVLAIARDITVLKKAEEEMQSGRKFLQSIIDSSLDVIQVFQAVRDETKKIIDFTWQMNNQKGFEQNGNVIGKSLLEQNTDIVPSEIFERMVHTCNTGVPIAIEQHYSFEQFREQWFYFSIVKHNDGIILTTRDITMKKKAEQEVLRSKDELARKATERYHELFNSIDQGFCTIKVKFDQNDRPLDYQFLEVSPSFQHQTGIEEAAGRWMRDISPDQDEFWFETYGRIALHRKSERFEYFSTPLARWWSVYAFPIDDPKLCSIGVLFNDITEQKQTEERQAFLLKLSDALSPLIDPLEIQSLACKLLCEHLHAQRVTYADIEGDEFIVRCSFVRGVDPITGRGLISAYPHAFLEEYQRTGIISVNNINTDPRFSEQERSNYLKLSIAATASIMLTKGGKWVASFAAHSSTPRQWNPAELSILKETAERIWSAVEKAKIEESLKKSEARLVAVFEALPVGVGFVDTNGEIVFSNEEMHRYLPTTTIPSRDEHRYSRWIGYDAGGNRVEKNNYPAARALRGERVVPGIEMIYTHDDGNDISLRISAVPLRDRENKIIGAVCVVTDINDLKKSTEALQKAEQQMRSVFEQAPLAIAIIGSSGEVLFRNTMFDNIWGRPPHDNTVSNYSDVYEGYHPDGRFVESHEWPAALAIFEGKVTNSQIFELVHSSGKRIPCSFNAGPIRDEKGNITGGVVMFRNVTTERKAEEALRHSEGKLRASEINYLIQLEEEVKKRTRELKESKEFIEEVTSTIPDFISIQDTSSNAIIYSNHDEFWKIYRQPYFQPDKMNDHERAKIMVHPQDLEKANLFLKERKLLADGQVMEVELKMVRENWVKIKSKVFKRDSKGACSQVLSITTNITERKKAEEELNEQAHFIRSITNTIPDIITVMEYPSRKIKYINKTVLLSHGFNPEDMLEQSEDERLNVLYPEDVIEVMNYYKQFEKVKDDEVVMVECRAKNEKGQFVWLRVRGKVFRRDSNGLPKYILHIAQNVNNQKIAEEQLIQLKLSQQNEILHAVLNAQEEERKNIAESLHNGLAQILYAIKIRMELLRMEEQKAQKSEIDKLLVQAIDEARNISLLLSPQLLEVFGLKQAIESMVSNFNLESLLIKFKFIGAEASRLSPELEIAIFRIVQELINNIIKHSQASIANIVLEISNQSLVLTVKDDGVGFKRNPGKISGMGLRMVENRIRLLNGTITIESNEGTRVAISIRF